jgi:magnesium transporter
MSDNNDHYNEKALKYARTDLPLIHYENTVGEALDIILREGVGEKIIYFYAVDDEKHLHGVVPTRRLLTSQRDIEIKDVMIKKVVSINHDATVFDVCEYFVLHRFLALPIVDDDNKILGMVDISLFTNEIIDMDNKSNINHIFEVIGFSFSDVSNASSIKAFRYRFPWLLTTIMSGMICAFLTGFFATTLEESIVIAFFMTMLLGLGESVSIQTMTLTIQVLGMKRPTFGWFVKAFKKEVISAVLLGFSCGAVVSVLVFLWHRVFSVAATIGLSVACAIIFACMIGLCIPSFLHAFKLDPKISAGPVTLAFADIFTLAVYFYLASTML